MKKIQHRYCVTKLIEAYFRFGFRMVCVMKSIRRLNKLAKDQHHADTKELLAATCTSNSVRSLSPSLLRPRLPQEPLYDSMFM